MLLVGEFDDVSVNVIASLKEDDYMNIRNIQIVYPLNKLTENLHRIKSFDRCIKRQVPHNSFISQNTMFAAIMFATEKAFSTEY